MIDLYAALGIKKDAEAKAIRAAYLKKAKEHHPDAGGDRARFEEVKLAYDVLSDPQRRKRYDDGNGYETGQAKARTPEMIAAGVLSRLLDEVLFSQLSAERADTIDLIVELKAALAEDRKEIEGHVRVGTEVVTALRKLEKRLKKRPEADVVGAQIATRLAAADKEMLRLAEALMINALAEKMLQGYEFSPGKRPAEGVNFMNIVIRGINEDILRGGTTT